jgi:hypothetical protein
MVAHSTIHKSLYSSQESHIGSSLLQYIYVCRSTVKETGMSKALSTLTEHQIPAFGLLILIINLVAIYLGEKEICPSVNMRVNTGSLLAFFKTFHIL